MNVKKKLSVGDSVTVKTIDGSIRTGIITKFGEHVAIISCEIHRYVVHKDELKQQGLIVPKFKRREFFQK